MEPSLALQAAIRARLVASKTVTAIIHPDNILDRNATPALDHSIILGEGITGPDDGLSRTRHVVVLDLHLWRKEKSLVGAKQVAHVIRQALSDGPLAVAGYHVADLRLASVRFLRDPGGQHSHGILSLEARLVETA